MNNTLTVLLFGLPLGVIMWSVSVWVAVVLFRWVKGTI